MCVPLVAEAVFHEIEYGEAVSSAPRFTPSSLNCTPATPALSAALAETVTVPDTVPAAGALSDTVGGVVSGTALFTVTVTAAEVVLLPAASRATAVSVCVPLVAEAVFQEPEYGDAVSSVPRFAPSSLNCTPATPTLSVALAETVTVPDTAPTPGEVIATAGGVVSDEPSRTLRME